MAALEHPAFYGWFGDVDEAELTSAQSASYARRFRAMSRWLAAAGDQAVARQAATIAYHLRYIDAPGVVHSGGCSTHAAGFARLR